MNDRTRPTWRDVRHLLAEYDGSASEIFILDLPNRHLTTVIQTIAELPSPQISMFRSIGLEQPEPLDAQWLQRLGVPPEKLSQDAFVSAYGTERHLQIDLWHKSEYMEINLVFWNDLTFPPQLTTDELGRRLDRLVDFAEACRAGCPGSICILYGERYGDPRELLDCRKAVKW